MEEGELDGERWKVRWLGGGGESQDGVRQGVEEVGGGLLIGEDVTRQRSAGGRMVSEGTQRWKEGSDLRWETGPGRREKDQGGRGWGAAQRGGKEGPNRLSETHQSTIPGTSWGRGKEPGYPAEPTGQKEFRNRGWRVDPA